LKSAVIDMLVPLLYLRGLMGQGVCQIRRVT
jgi:hypothetical protein